MQPTAELCVRKVSMQSLCLCSFHYKIIIIEKSILMGDTVPATSVCICCLTVHRCNIWPSPIPLAQAKGNRQTGAFLFCSTQLENPSPCLQHTHAGGVGLQCTLEEVRFSKHLALKSYLFACGKHDSTISVMPARHGSNKREDEFWLLTKYA